ncbi:MAG: hypothetical protein U9N87_01955 [Planctomycetota bacterium]|nr:hypothetical protein [Planctomycetota bacterium]
MGKAYEVLSYSIDTLCSLLAKKVHSPKYRVERKQHLDYFRSYFAELNSRTIIVENDYIDRDFLEDYAAYYVRCFHGYERKCTRLHFFNFDFSGPDFERLLAFGSGSDFHQKLQDGYLGFVVIKPLPETFVGRTCLRTYDENGSRSCPIARQYHANLFGINLTIEKTLAFQEQDTVAAACATSALWSAFHGTGTLFHHAIPSPVEITKTAGPLLSGERSLPNHGLTTEQMANAIRAVGLEPFPIRAQDEFIFKTTVYAYVRGRIPVLMLVHLYDISNPQNAEFLGGHAVTVTGFGCGDREAGVAEFQSKACEINRIYAHDDGIGPFARMVLDGKKVGLGPPSDIELMSLSTSWKDAHDSLGNVRAVPVNILVPLYHKIRIPFALIQNAVMHFDQAIDLVANQGGNEPYERLYWDVFLSPVSDFKESIFKSKAVDDSMRESVLSEQLPRFLWRATASSGARKVLDLLFDATDIEQGKLLVLAVEYHNGFGTFLRSIARLPTIREHYRNTPGWVILQYFAEDDL